MKWVAEQLLAFQGLILLLSLCHWTEKVVFLETLFLFDSFNKDNFVVCLTDLDDIFYQFARAAILHENLNAFLRISRRCLPLPRRRKQHAGGVTAIPFVNFTDDIPERASNFTLRIRFVMLLAQFTFANTTENYRYKNTRWDLMFYECKAHDLLTEHAGSYGNVSELCSGDARFAS
jgi:hypothetical protein